MELGLDFDDEDLCVENKEIKQPLKSYNAKTCHQKWFLTAEGEDNESRANINKFKADYYYGKRQYEQAATYYREGLEYLSSQNRVMRKDMMESLSRCYAYLGDQENTFKVVTELMADITTIDNMVQVLILKQQILDKFGMLQDEIKVIKQLIGYHPYNAQFWLLLVKTYKQVLSNCDIDNSDSIETDKFYSTNKTENCVSDIKNSNECSCSHIEDKLEKTLTLFGSRSQEGHLVSCVNCSEHLCQYSYPSTSLSYTCKKTENNLEGCDETVDRGIENSEKCHKCNCHHQRNDGYKWNGTQKVPELNSSSKNVLGNSVNGIPPKLMLLTSSVRARLLLRSVQGTVGSFIKARNLEHLSQVEKEIQELCLDESVVKAATEFMMKDLHLIPEEDNEDTSPPVYIKTSTSTTEEFDEKWFAWVKNIGYCPTTMN